MALYLDRGLFNCHKKFTLITLPVLKGFHIKTNGYVPFSAFKRSFLMIMRNLGLSATNGSKHRDIKAGPALISSKYGHPVVVPTNRQVDD